MKMVADTNTFLAVAMDQPERSALIAFTRGRELLAPDVLPYEIGNALSAMTKRDLIDTGQAARIWDVTRAIPVTTRSVDIRAALLLASDAGIYAYDAYFLRCAIETASPLLTLDRGMQRVAARLGIPVEELP